MIEPTEPVHAIDDLGTELRESVGRLVRRLRAEKANDQMGDTPSSVLLFLVKEGPHTLRQLSDQERVTPPSMNQTVNALADAGYVVREPDPTDGRKVLIVATPEGVTLATETRRRRHAWLDGHLEKLSPEQRQIVLEATRIFREIADS